MAKRLLSLVVAMLLVLSLAPVALASTDAAIAAVAAEAISTEPLGFVTKSLTLPTEVEGTVISWQSSDPSVIATNGTVTRNNLVDKTVTLTASVGAETIATHTVTVLSQLKTVGFSDTFKVDDTVTSYVGVNGWAASNTTLVPTKSAGNTTLCVTQSADQGYGYVDVPVATAFPNGVGTSGLYTIEFDVTLPAANVGYSLQFWNNHNYRTGRINFYNKQLAVLNNTSNDQWHTRDGNPCLYSQPNTTDWGGTAHIKYQYNPTTQRFSVSYDGATIVPDGASENPGTTLTGIGFYAGSRSKDTISYIDNLVVYTEDVLSDDTINSWSNEEKVAFFAEKVDVDKITATPELVTSNLDLAAALTGYDLAAYGVSLTWSSSNTARITNAGVVDSTSIFDENVTMTATVSCGEASKPLTKTVTVGQPSTSVSNNYLGDFNSKIPGTDTLDKFSFVNDDAQHGVVAKVTGDSVATNTIYNLNYYTKRWVLKTDLKISDESEDASDNAKFELYTQGGARGTEITFNFTDRKIKVQRGTPTEVQQYVSLERKYIEYPMPEALQKDSWFNLAIDYVAPSKSIQIYINGEALDEIPVENVASTTHKVEESYKNSAVRGYKVTAPANASVYVDNISIKYYSNDDITKVAAALNAFKMVYLSNRDNPSLRADVGTFPTAGPADGSVHDATNYQPYNFIEIPFAGGATLSYKINGVTATKVDTSTLPSNATIEITATSNNVSKTITATKNIGAAGVKLVRATGASASEFDSVYVMGDVVGKKVFVLLVDDEGTIYQTKVSTIDETNAATDISGAYKVGMNGASFWNGSDAIGKTLKVFILDENLKPYSMPYTYKITGSYGE